MSAVKFYCRFVLKSCEWHNVTYSYLFKVMEYVEISVAIVPN